MSEKTKNAKDDFCECPIKVVYSEETEEFSVVEGAFELGYWGKYDIEKISMEEPGEIIESVLEATEKSRADRLLYLPLKPYITENMSNAELADALSRYYNDRIADMKKHITEINQTFLAYVLDDLCGCSYPFWEFCPNYVKTDLMPKCDADEYEEMIYSNEAVDAISKIFNKYYETEHCGEVLDDTDAEDIFKKYFPMFDLEKMISDIKPMCVYFQEALISIECDGKGQLDHIICAAMAEISSKNAYTEWHNH